MCVCVCVCVCVCIQSIQNGFIHQQTNPHGRLKVLDLINHPWLLKNSDAPVDWATRINVSVW